MSEHRRGDSNKITRDYLDSLLIETRYIGSTLPDTSMELFGEKFSTPVMLAAFSHLDKFYGCPTGMADTAMGAKMADAVMWAGMGSEQELESMIATGAKVIKIIKPYADEKLIFTQLEEAKRHGCIAVGMDVDHIFTTNGRLDVIDGDAMSPKSPEDIRRYVEFAGLPFIIKGVLSVKDAMAAYEAGCKGIVISHHHGVVNYAVPPLKILPEIAQAVGGKMKIFVDCSMDSGFDAYKALALGADAVCVSRLILEDLVREGANGVYKRLLAMTNELTGCMARTGVTDLKSMDSSVIRKL